MEIFAWCLGLQILEMPCFLIFEPFFFNISLVFKVLQEILWPGISVRTSEFSIYTRTNAAVFLHSIFDGLIFTILQGKKDENCWIFFHVFNWFSIISLLNSCYSLCLINKSFLFHGVWNKSFIWLFCYLKSSFHIAWPSINLQLLFKFFIYVI